MLPLQDEALLRPGRLEVQVEIGLPDDKGRLQILKASTVACSDSHTAWLRYVASELRRWQRPDGDPSLSRLVLISMPHQGYVLYAQRQLPCSGPLHELFNVRQPLAALAPQGWRSGRGMAQAHHTPEAAALVQLQPVPQLQTKLAGRALPSTC